MIDWRQLLHASFTLLKRFSNSGAVAQHPATERRKKEEQDVIKRNDEGKA
jgi:hypothetical protein